MDKNLENYVIPTEQLDALKIKVPETMIHVAWTHRYMGQDLIRTWDIPISEWGNKSITPDNLYEWIRVNFKDEDILTNVISWQLWEKI